MLKRMSIFFKFFIFFFCIFIINLNSHSRDPVRGENGMVVSASGLASEVGISILRKGGNAVDAAVATGFALAVTHPSAGNIGGGGFMVIRLADGTETSINYREKAPLKAHRDMFLDEFGNYAPELSQYGMTSSGVPGSVAGLLYAHKKYGSLSLQDVIQPAIDLAQNGFPLEYRVADFINAYNEIFNRYESSREIFTKSGALFNIGDTLVQKDLAQTLIRIRDYGMEGFYSGKTADLLVAQSKELGGLITLDDLKKYSAQELKPLNGNYRGFKIISMAPPSSGGVALIETLNILENFHFTQQDWNSSNYIHILVEALKHTYADRAMHLGDPDFYPVPVDELISKKYASQIASSIGFAARSSTSIYAGNFNKTESDETTHYSVIDQYGNAVSTTTTLNSSFGNKIVVEGAGFLMNNEMDDFSAKPGVPNQFGLLGAEANSIMPEKRMLSSMTPTIVLKEDKPFIILGAPGGATIITSVIQTVINCIDFNMDIQEAIDAPRVHHQWNPDRIDYETYGLTNDQMQNLIKRGYNLGIERTIGRVQGIMIDDYGVRWGASDPRSNGKAVGY